MKNLSIFIGILLLWSLPMTLLHAKELIIYPTKGQSAAKMKKDLVTQLHQAPFIGKQAISD